MRLDKDGGPKSQKGPPDRRLINVDVTSSRRFLPLRKDSI